MSNKKSRRMADRNNPGGHGRAAMARAHDALFAGDSREAERWSRVAERLNNAPAPEEEVEDDETIRRRLEKRLDRFIELHHESRAAAYAEERKRLEEIDREWEIAVWSEWRVERGLPPLEFVRREVDYAKLAEVYGWDHDPAERARWEEAREKARSRWLDQ